MKKNILLSLIFATFTAISSAQSFVPNKVDGLELPAKMEVNNNQKPITVEAKSAGLVKWLVLSSETIKYTIDEQKNKVVINLPKQGEIKILAIALIEGKNSEFAATNIVVKTPEVKKEVTNEKPKVIMFLDYSSLTNEQLKIINNQYTNLYTSYKCYDLSSPLLSNEKYLSISNQGSAKSLMIVESNDGKILWSGPVPSSEKETQEIIKATLN